MFFFHSMHHNLFKNMQAIRNTRTTHTSSSHSTSRPPHLEQHRLIIHASIPALPSPPHNGPAHPPHDPPHHLPKSPHQPPDRTTDGAHVAIVACSVCLMTAALVCVRVFACGLCVPWRYVCVVSCRGVPVIVLIMSPAFLRSHPFTTSAYV